METKPKSTKEKGAELEQEFKKYMKQKLDYEKCISNTKVKGRLSTNEYEVDIIGKKLNENGEKIKNIGHILLFVGIAAFILAIFKLMFFVENDLWIFGGLLIIGWVLSDIGKKRMYEYTWVECKNWSNKIGKNTITELNSKVKDYHESEDKKFDFNKILLVSAKGFIQNSLRFAEEYEIECYERKSKNKFKLIKVKTIR